MNLDKMGYHKFYDGVNKNMWSLESYSIEGIGYINVPGEYRWGSMSQNTWASPTSIIEYPDHLHWRM